MNIKTLLLRLCTHSTQADWKTSADGIEFMDPAVKTLKAALEAIRNTALNALREIDDSQEQLSMRWTCKDCRYIKHFTTPVPLEAAGRCPRCKNTEFRPVL
jgi:predicted Zn-ribbon and HTH transcriptional regulator